MSPKRFSVTITSKPAGRSQSFIVMLSTSWCSSCTSGKSSAISSASSRQSRELSSTFALSTLVRCPRRSRASRKPVRRMRLISCSL